MAEARVPGSVVSSGLYTGHPHSSVCLGRPETRLQYLVTGSGRPLVITKQIISLVMIEARKQYPINYCHKGQQYIQPAWSREETSEECLCYFQNILFVGRQIYSWYFPFHGPFHFIITARPQAISITIFPAI